MTTHHRFHERSLPFDADSIAVGAALAASCTDDYVLFEHRGAVAWAEAPYATVEAAAGSTSLVVDGRTHHFEAGSRPLDPVGQALAELRLEGWRAYGWAPFELSYALHGAGRLTPDTPIAHLAVPRREIRLERGTALLRAIDENDLDSLELRLSTAVAAADKDIPEERIEADVQNHDADSYRASVAAAVAEIRSGALDKVILSRVVPVDEAVDIPSTYLVGRRGNNPARSFLLRLGGWHAAGFSPEIVSRVTAEGRVTTQPLAGTRALEGDPTADRARRAELYRDPKEVFEHAISVRLAVDELDRVCEPETVTVDDFMIVKPRGSVQHLASKLSGNLAPEHTAWDALAALFPAITASGIPKRPACDLIARSESQPRGLYSGAVLTVDADGSMDAALVLRSIYQQDGRTWLRAGAGIVADSTPERELEETREKLRSVSRFLVPAVDAPLSRQLTAAAVD
ncbi:salicylate synthase [Kitasatospora sp. NPDC094019]|uniref:salicylate synthase n=1 Tax=Kitasatospora sp. NPDC094019 TaxID=3364091 RepID=UPI0038153111